MGFFSCYFSIMFFYHTPLHVVFVLLYHYEQSFAHATFSLYVCEGGAKRSGICRAPVTRIRSTVQYHYATQFQSVETQIAFPPFRPPQD